MTCQTPNVAGYRLDRIRWCPGIHVYEASNDVEITAVYSLSPYLTRYERRVHKDRRLIDRLKDEWLLDALVMDALRSVIAAAHGES